MVIDSSETAEAGALGRRRWRLGALAVWLKVAMIERRTFYESGREKM
jgi:hypothetical protein